MQRLASKLLPWRSAEEEQRLREEGLWQKRDGPQKSARPLKDEKRLTRKKKSHITYSDMITAASIFLIPRLLLFYSRRKVDLPIKRTIWLFIPCRLLICCCCGLYYCCQYYPRPARIRNWRKALGRDQRGSTSLTTRESIRLVRWLWSLFYFFNLSRFVELIKKLGDQVGYWHSERRCHWLLVSFLLRFPSVSSCETSLDSRRRYCRISVLPYLTSSIRRNLHCRLHFEYLRGSRIDEYGRRWKERFEWRGGMLRSASARSLDKTFVRSLTRKLRFNYLSVGGKVLGPQTKEQRDVRKKRRLRGTRRKRWRRSWKKEFRKRRRVESKEKTLSRHSSFLIVYWLSTIFCSSKGDRKRETVAEEEEHRENVFLLRWFCRFWYKHRTSSRPIITISFLMDCVFFLKYLLKRRRKWEQVIERGSTTNNLFMIGWRTRFPIWEIHSLYHHHCVFFLDER